MVQKLSYLFYGVIVTTTLFFSNVSRADYCDGSQYCRTDGYGYTYYCEYAPNYCGGSYGGNYNNGAVTFGIPYYFNGSRDTNWEGGWSGKQGRHNR